MFACTKRNGALIDKEEHVRRPLENLSKRLVPMRRRVYDDDVE